MLNKIRKSKISKVIAVFTTVSLFTEMLIPLKSYALTSGPSQPEVQSFEPVATTDMVDVFSGDFNYNIPLMQVGNYPINMFYHAGIGMDQEASWTGLGWNINPGVINRNMRGIPDDFNGDEIIRTQNIKPNETIGVSIGGNIEVYGIGFSPGFRFYHNNYKGLGYGMSSGLSLGPLSMSFGYDNQEGVDASLGLTMQGSLGSSSGEAKIKAGASLGYNSRQGLKGLTISASVSTSVDVADAGTMNTSHGGSTYISFVAPTYTPFTTPDMASFVGSMRFNIGGEGYGIYGSGYISADFQSHRLLKHTNTYASTGYLYETEHTDPGVIMDLSRDKQVELNKYTRFLHTTNHAYDIYSVSGQGISGMYRPFRNNVGMVYDPETKGVDLSSLSFSSGLEVGVGGLFKIGGDINVGFSVSHMGPWRDNFQPYDNLQFSELNPPPDNSNPAYEAVYFKTVGEHTLSDQTYYDEMLDTKALRIDLTSNFNTAGLNRFETNEPTNTYLAINNSIKKEGRDKRNQSITYLTAEEAAAVRSTGDLKYYKFSGAGIVEEDYDRIDETGEIRKSHHISEIIVTNPDGTRYVYGIAAYNTSQEEYTFSVDHPSSEPTDGLIPYVANDITVDNDNGRDNYFYKEEIPPYAYAYLLTAILSPDYVDVSDNGISDDDLGNYTKINYLKAYDNYEWRTPYDLNKANYNRALRSDALDDKGNFIYGTKEIWYVHSVETKTHVAEFSLSTRTDSYGVTDLNGGIDDQMPLFKLDEINLFSRPDRIINTNSAVPIKTAHFEYDYSLCKNSPNNTNYDEEADPAPANSGKLTLKELSFSYGNNTSGQLSPYVFNYDETDEDANPDYDMKGSDRWGTYKPNNTSLLNADFPYTPQDDRTNKADKYAAAWNLRDVILPSGGVITVNYQADDYAYVQDKAATFMYKIKGFTSTPTSAATTNDKYLFSGNDHKYYAQFELTQAVSNIDEIFSGLDKVYFNCMVNLSPTGDPENVTGYAEIEEYGLIGTLPSQIGYLKLKSVEIGTGWDTDLPVSPISKAAWQFTRVYRPQIAYPGSENVSTTDAEAALDGMMGFVANVRQLFEGFNNFMQDENYCREVTLNQSWIRLNAQNKTKVGGGHRVSKIEFNDSWNYDDMATNEQDMTYGQEYAYINEDGTTSGVAAYEPMIGGDENACRYPLHNYTREQILAPDDDHYVEGPVGESFYPGASIGYERIVVKNITPSNVTRHATGYTVHEFYTAREFPVRYQDTDIEVEINKPSPILTFLNFYYEEYATASQGYTIELNDMHGKQKAQTVYQEPGQTAQDESAIVSSVRYFYKVDDENALTKNLRNENLTVMSKTGSISDEATIGKEIEMVVDTKEKSDYNVMTGVQVNADGFMVSVVPVIIPTPWPSISVSQRRVRFATTTKIVNRFGILEKTEALQNGATIATYNEIYDEETGDVLLTRTQNEYRDNIYNFNYPAYWAYDNMGPAYKNVGASGTIEIANGVADYPSDELYNVFTPGDEVLLGYSLITDQFIKAWVLDKELVDGTPDHYKVSFVDEFGNPINNGNTSTLDFDFKIIRSGRRNQQALSAGTVVSKKSPIVSDVIDVDEATEILNSSATIYSDEWQTQADMGKLEAAPVSCELGGIKIEEFIDFMDDLVDDNYGVHSSSDFPFVEGFPSGCTYTYTGGLNDASPAERNSFMVTLEYECASSEGACRVMFRTINGAVVDLTAISGFSPEIEFDPTIQGWDNIMSTGLYVTANTPGGPVIFEILSDHECLNVTMDCDVGTPIVADCGSEREDIVNPYLVGLRGIWRPEKGYAYNSTREYAGTGNDLNARYDGTYTDFEAFWSPNSGDDWTLPANLDDPDPALNKWIWTSEVTKYHPAGNEVENRDALGRYSAALFGYWNTQATAVASNAKYRQIAFDGFEDYDFQESYDPSKCHYLDHFSFLDDLVSPSDITTTKAHTGRYSIKVEPEGTTGVNRAITQLDPEFRDDFITEYVMLNQDNLGIFSPETGKYVISLWVNTGVVDVNDADVKVRLFDNTEAEITANSITLNPSADQPIIEGWRRIEGTFEIPSNAVSISVELNNDDNTNDVYFDDIRIHPFNSNMKTFVYDKISLRLLAQLDENNYSTFYEYDDQGTLVRVKKETERGVFTLQENRQNLNKHPQ